MLKKSNCKNCYKCIRHCPVKSIRFSGNQAHIIGDECILCGHCFVVCPQNAKEIVNDTERVKVLLQGREPVYVSLAPSFAANYDDCGIEDMENFAAVFYTAKRTGGDMSGIIQTSARMLGDKIDVKKEIETTLAAKKAEQMVMSLMPAGIILYLKLTSPGFLGVLYGNPFGIAAMTLCLGIYGFSYWLGRKIVDIEV